jgi:hypothetical protein
MQYLILKLVTSEFVIGKVDHKDDEGCTLSDTTVLKYEVDLYDYKSYVYMVPYNTFSLADRVVFFKSSHIMQYLSCDEDFVTSFKKYIARTYENISETSKDDQKQANYYNKLLLSSNTSIN